MIAKRIAVLGSVFLLLLGGCTQVLTEVAQKAYEDRSTEDQVTDTKISAAFLDKLTNKDKGLLLDVSIDVWEQRVLLAGVVDSSALKSDILAMVKADQRIKKLYDHISVVTTAERDKRREDAEKGGDDDNTNDFWLEIKIKGQLLTAKDVTSVNYRWRSVENMVFILGKAVAPGERDRVLALVKDVKGVKSVRDYITGN